MLKGTGASPCARGVLRTILRRSSMKANLVYCSILALAAAVALPAQYASPIVKAAVPFDFTVQGRTLPAGDYVVDQGGNGSAVLLKCRDHSRTAIVPTNHLQSAVPQNAGQRVLHRY